jgi:hypothetical protein
LAKVDKIKSSKEINVQDILQLPIKRKKDQLEEEAKESQIDQPQNFEHLIAQQPLQNPQVEQKLFIKDGKDLGQSPMNEKD